MRARRVASADALRLLEAIEQHHPEPHRYVARTALRRQAELAARVESGERSHAVVELMRLTALLGERNGHTAILPWREHPRPFTAYPIRIYEFDEGAFIVDATASDLVGSEVVAVAGVPVADAMAALTPLIAHDNAWTIRERQPGFLVAAEVLEGLEIAERNRPVSWRLRAANGQLRDVTVEPLPAPERERLLHRPRPPRQLQTLAGGRALLVSYDITRGETTGFAAEIASRARGAEIVALDLRRNAGGDNQSYRPLLETLETLTAQGKQLAVLTSRVTFSAAMQLIVDLEQRTPAVFVGEPTGGSPNQYGDAVTVTLDTTSIAARVATISWTTAGADDSRTTREPDIAVPAAASTFFSGRDPVLAAALELRAD